ncbi:DUF1707 domain-containing protein [Saccharopolyspora sp. K220]|uniref:DUF1707 SHOCT-like domain-containing protein n=1 Tax=Saccharopolyspora soli TaxID=2926618 RepID=UPI001F55C691|nr:DUF1707 domain-containing protein [Saccharopolyspora soli]MCI2419114.1 DUF1707 domain-containing protein [Saccharopolyspora soli]
MDNGRRGKDLRIGDPERERAMRLLGEHFSAGRLEVHEYDERCQQAAVARFSSELDALFDDLPAPRPNNPPVVPAAAAARSVPTSGKVVLAICAAALLVFLIVVARQLGLVLLVPLVALIWFTWRR